MSLIDEAKQKAVDLQKQKEIELANKKKQMEQEQSNRRKAQEKDIADKNTEAVRLVNKFHAITNGEKQKIEDFFDKARKDGLLISSAREGKLDLDCVLDPLGKPILSITENPGNLLGTVIKKVSKTKTSYIYSVYTVGWVIQEPSTGSQMNIFLGAIHWKLEVQGRRIFETMVPTTTATAVEEKVKNWLVSVFSPKA